MPLGYGPFPIFPGLQFFALVLFLFIAWQAGRHGWRLGLALPGSIAGVAALCLTFHTPLMMLRFELGRPAIEAEIAALVNGKSRFPTMQRSPGDFVAFPQWPIGTHYVNTMDAGLASGTARITTEGVFVFTTCGFEVNFQTAPDGTLVFSAWTPWVYDK